MGWGCHAGEFGLADFLFSIRRQREFSTLTTDIFCSLQALSGPDEVFEGDRHDTVIKRKLIPTQ